MRLDTPEGALAPSRRSIAASLFFSGYATAALSSCASPVRTPEDELAIADVHVPGAGGYQLPAYVARPNDREAHGAVIVVNEIFGIHDYIKDVCRRFAREGYVAIAPDYFDRAGDPAPLTDFAQIRQIVATATYEQVMGDTAGALDWLADQRFVARNEVAGRRFDAEPEPDASRRDAGKAQVKVTHQRPAVGVLQVEPVGGERFQRALGGSRKPVERREPGRAVRGAWSFGMHDEI